MRRTLGQPDTGTVRVALWADGLFMYQGGGTHGAGRWRLNGDTLWWGNDGRYENHTLFLRQGIPHGDTVDTLTMPDFPKNDSLFWTATKEEREQKKAPDGNYYWHRTAYTISLKDGRLTMIRVDDLSTGDWHPSKGVYVYKHDEPVQP